jgi:GAF domain-containing protein
MMEHADLYKKKFSIFQEISSAIVAMDNISSISVLMLDLAVNYANAEKGSIMLLDDKGELYVLAARGVDMSLARTYRVKIGEGIAGTVAEARVPVLVENIDADVRFKDKKRNHYNTPSFICCPIVSKNRLLGVLNINDKKDNSVFTEDEFELMNIISNQAAIALENTSLLNQLKSKAVELEEINRKLMGTDVAKTEFLTRVSHELRTPLNSIKGAIYHLQRAENIAKNDEKEFHAIIADETEKLIKIIEHLIDFIRLEDEMKVVRKTMINISDLIRETFDAALVTGRITGQKLHLTLDLKNEVSEIVGDKIKIGQFFINLIDGLSHYLVENDAIFIGVSENYFVEIAVDISRKMPDIVSYYLSSVSRILNTDQPEEIVKLYLARKMAEVHQWTLEVHNAEHSCRILIRIPKSSEQKMDAAITMTTDLFVEFIAGLLDVDICSIMLTDELTGELVIKSAHGLSQDIVKNTRIRPGDRIAGWVAMEGKPLLIHDIEHDPRFGRKNIAQYSTKSLISVPLKRRGSVVGVLNLNNKRGAEQFSLKDFEIAALLSDRVSHLIDRLLSGDLSTHDLKRMTKSFSSLISAEKKYDKKQSVFSDLTLLILDCLGASDEDKKIALYISMVYDIGLMLVDEKILKKKSLSPSEQRRLKYHPHNSLSLIEGIEFSDVVKKAVLHHHERYDGTGYPDGLKGDEIPFLARVMAVADSFCAMTMERPYRERVSPSVAMEEIRRGSGSRYDPAVVRALEKVLGDDALNSTGIGPTVRGNDNGNE